MAAALEALRPPPAPARPHGRLRVAGARTVVDGVAMSIAATVATAPLLALHFGRVPLAGLPANLLALPAVAPVMWLGMTKAAVGQLASLGTPVAPLASALASALGWVTGVPLGYLSWVARAFADVRGGVVTPPVRSPVTLAMAYGLLLAGWAGASHLVRRGRDRAQEAAGAWRRLARTRRTAVVAVAGAALLAVLGHLLGPPRPPHALTVRFLDVGQGDATLIQDPSGAAILFDGGPPEAAAWRLLRRAGVRRLAAVVATHGSRDHHGGIVDVLHRLPVDVLFDGGDGTREAGFRAMESEADRLGIRRVVARAGTAFAVGSLSVRVLSPPPRAPGPPPEDPNPRGIVAVVSSGDFDLLLSADAESVALLPLTLPDVDAMKVPHHGSADAGLPEVLGRLRPEVAAIEVGEGNTYGHPTPSTLHALARAGARTYRTDRDGTVSLTVEKGEMRVDTER
jgi:competence protein ComEC